MISRKNKKMTIMLCFIMGIALLCSLLALGPDMNAQAAGRSEEPPEIFDIFIPVIANEYPPTCEQGIANGGFEEDSDWVLPVTAYSAVYSTANPLSGDRSLHAGISDSVDNIFSYSSARQEVTIPEGIPEAVLSFWLYPISSETGTLRLADNLLNIEEKDAEESSDAQLVIILDSSGEELERLLTIRENDQVWKPYSFDLAHYAGETIQIYFGVYNNGLGGVTSMFVDDVSLDYCETVPPPPDPVCWQGIANESFELDEDWVVPTTQYPAAYSLDEAKSGQQSMRSGIVKESENRYSYSSVYQTVAIPEGATDAALDFWLFPLSSEPAYLSLPTNLDDLRADNAESWGDVQLVIIYDTAWKELERLVHMRQNDGEWLPYSFDLSQYAGETIRVYFDVINNGHYGVTGMYIDDVTLTSCAVAP